MGGTGGGEDWTMNRFLKESGLFGEAEEYTVDVREGTWEIEY